MNAPPKSLKTAIFVTLLMLIGVTLLCSLGFWQLSRSHQKALLEQKAMESNNESALNRDALLTLKDPSQYLFTPVQLKSHLLNQHIILLDNKTNNGIVGYHVLIPAVLDNKTLILINRGWIPLPKHNSRATLPHPAPITGEVTIEGYLDFAYRNPLVHQALENNKIQWPLRMQQLDLRLLQDILGKEIYPMLVTLSKESPYAFVTPAKGVKGISKERHQGYAVQWFALALTLFICYLVVYFKYYVKQQKN